VQPANEWATLGAVNARARLVLLIVSALGLRLWFAWSDLESLLLRALSDDSFYYFEIARRLVNGEGASFDGSNPTNGFHPLWLLITACVQACVRDPLTAVHVSLSLGAVFGAATAGLTAAIVRRLGGNETASLVAGGIVAFHPTMVLESVNGMETSPALCAIATLVWLFVDWWQRTSVPSLAEAMAFGSAGGLMLLARTDSVFIWISVLFFLALRAGSVERLRPILIAAIVSGVWGAPWLIWNLLSFGTVVQVSAIALAEGLQADYLAQHGDTFGVALNRGWTIVRWAFADTLVHRYLVPRPLGAWIGWGLALSGLSLLLLTRDSRRRFGILMVPGVGILLGLFIHAGIRWWLREWYFAPAGWLTAACAGLGWVTVWERIPHLNAQRAVGLFVVLLIGFGWTAQGWQPSSPHVVQQLEGARWIAANTPEDARIGAFNAGIYGYFSGRTVVNLDGVVNLKAYRANRAGGLMDYVLAEKIEYVIDWRGTLPLLRCRDHASIRCQRVAVIGEHLDSFAGSPVNVIRIQSSIDRSRAPR